MNGKMVKEIKTNIEDVKIVVDDELDKQITVQIDRGLLEKQNMIANELITIGCSSFIKLAYDTLLEAVKYIKKVNFDKPNQQSIMSKLFGVPLDADYTSPSTWLYVQLFDMMCINKLFGSLLDKINVVEKEFNDMIQNNNLSNTNLSNKVVLLSQLEGLRQMKLSLLTLYNCYQLVLCNPQVYNFCYYWKVYKENVYKRLNQRYNLGGDFSYPLPENHISKVK